MKIVVKESNHNIRLRFPTGLILNGCTSAALCRAAGKHGVGITHGQMRTLIKALHRYRRSHPDWVLVEVSSTKGGYVQVKL